MKQDYCASCDWHICDHQEEKFKKLRAVNKKLQENEATLKVLLDSMNKQVENIVENSINKNKLPVLLAEYAACARNWNNVDKETKNLLTKQASEFLKHREVIKTCRLKT